MSMISLKLNVDRKKTYDMLMSEFPVYPIKDKDYYQNCLKVFKDLTKKVIIEEGFSRDEIAQMNEYLTLLGSIVAKYESETYKSANVSGAEILSQLLEDHNLTQSQLLDEIGAQPNVSAVLNGTRLISWDQAVRLGERFGLNPVVFMTR